MDSEQEIKMGVGRGWRESINELGKCAISREYRDFGGQNDDVIAVVVFDGTEILKELVNIYS